MSLKEFLSGLALGFGGGFFIGFITAVYAAVTLFGTAAMSG